MLTFEKSPEDALCFFRISDLFADCVLPLLGSPEVGPVAKSICRGGELCVLWLVGLEIYVSSWGIHPVQFLQRPFAWKIQDVGQYKKNNIMECSRY